MQASPAQAALPVGKCPQRSCLKKKPSTRKLMVRFELGTDGPARPPAQPSGLLAPPPRALRLVDADGGHNLLRHLARYAQPAKRQLWLACGLMGTYHTLLHGPHVRQVVFAACFVLPASRTLFTHGLRGGVAHLMPRGAIDCVVAAAAAGAGICVGLAGPRGA